MEWFKVEVNSEGILVDKETMNMYRDAYDDLYEYRSCEISLASFEKYGVRSFFSTCLLEKKRKHQS